MTTILLILFSTMFQLTPFEVVDEATLAYEAGDYARAIALYEVLLENEFEDAAVYYNLGNAYYASGQPGLSLVNYLRANRLSPRDAEIITQINRVRAERVDFQGDETTPIDRLARFSQVFMTTTELRNAVLTLWFSLFVVATGWFILEKRRSIIRPIVIGNVVILLLGLVLLFPRIYVETERPKAVVIDLIVEARSGPDEDYLVLFPLYAGAELRVVETREGWSRFVLPDGRQGWLPTTTLETVRTR